MKKGTAGIPILRFLQVAQCHLCRNSRVRYHSVTCLDASFVYRMPRKGEITRKRGRDNEERKDKNVKDCGEHGIEKKKKVGKTGSEIKIISWNVAGLRAWIKVSLIYLDDFWKSC